MQFVAHGPDIPESLLQAHEEGRLVFFCGAGISYPAGLPGFRGLVDSIYSALGTVPDEIEQDAYNREHFDATLDLLERRIPGQRLAVRRALANALHPNLRRKGATDVHAALLELSHTTDGSVRLVTTNFDQVFQKTSQRLKKVLPGYSAPLLPVPKNSRWNGIVYLHGLLPFNGADDALHKLVVTSGDFGLAYPHYVIHLLNEGNLPRTFPAQTLDLLSIVVPEDTWPDGTLREVLNSIVQASPDMHLNRDYLRLDAHLRQRNL